MGTPTTVTLSFHIDGRTAAGFGAAFVSGPVIIGLPADFTLQSSVDARLRLDVYDLDSPHYEGGAPIARVNYVSAANVESGLYSPSSSYPNGAAYTNVGHQVLLQVNDPKVGDWNWSGNDSSSSSFSDAWPTKQVFDVNTGVLSLSFDTLVGNHINLEGSLNTSIYCSSYSNTGTAPSCAGLSDFSHTFDAELTSSVPGVTFSDYTPGVFPAAAVPEPDAWVLVLAGAAGLLWRRRGQRAAKTT